MDRALAPNLRIRFPKPGFFVTDVRLVLTLNGHVIYDGSFMGGLDLTVPVAVGRHVLATRIDLGGLARTREYTLDVTPGHAFSIELAYSRFWGNFKKGAALVRHA